MNPTEMQMESLIEYEPNPESKSLEEWNKLTNLTTKKKALIPPAESKPDLQSLLKAILPPREWDQDGKHFVQYVSHNKASRENVTSLQTKLDERLITRQARENGICPIREELHSQCYDEIIRQATIECPERGLLLMRVRDEMRMTIAAYQTMFKSASDYSVKKQIDAERGKTESEANIKSLSDKNAKLSQRRADLAAKKRAIETRIRESREYDKGKKAEELKYLDDQLSNLRLFFSNMNKAAEQA